MSINNYGRCFNLSEFRKECKTLCHPVRCCSPIQKNMKQPVLYNIFTQMCKLSDIYSTKRINVQNCYIDFMETMLNLSPSIAEESFKLGMKYFDDDQTYRKYYQLESFLEVRLVIMKVCHQKKHATQLKKIQTVFLPRNEYFNYTCPLTACNRTSCVFITVEYQSFNSERNDLPILCVLLNNTPEKYIMNTIPPERIANFISMFEFNLSSEQPTSSGSPGAQSWRM